MKKAVKIENFIDEKLEKQSEVRNSLRQDRKTWIEKNEHCGDFDVDSDSGSYVSEKDLIGVLNIEKVPDLENESSKQEKESQATLKEEKIDDTKGSKGKKKLEKNADLAEIDFTDGGKQQPKSKSSSHNLNVKRLKSKKSL